MTAEDFSEVAAPLPDPLLLVAGDGRVVAVNEAAVRLLGRPRPGVVGRALEELVADPPDRVHRQLVRWSRSPELTLGALRWRRADGALIACRSDGALVRPGASPLLLLRCQPRSQETLSQRFEALNRRIAELSREVTERQRAATLLFTQREALRITLASIGDAVITTDPEGRVTFVNPTAAAVTGWSAEEAQGRPLDAVLRLINEETRRTVEHPVARVLREGRVIGLANHSVLIAKDGREYPIEDSAAPIRDPDGEIHGVVLVFHDVSERRQIERERSRLLEREREARREAEAANQAKDEFLAILGHELRNPLAAISSAVAGLERGSSEPTAARLRAIIARQARHLTRLVDDLLDVARVATGKMELQRQPVELGDLVERVVSGFRESSRLGRHDVRLRTEPVWIEGDPVRVEQVFANLLDNALEYTPPGGAIDIAVAAEPDGAVLRVRDTGVGIDPDLLPRVFDLFVQADRSLQRRGGGLGLGLGLVRRLVALHGGTIEAHSAGPGQGSAFVVRLPLLPGPGAEAGRPRLAPGVPPRHILIVEDNDDARESLRLALEVDGHRVDETSDGQRGVALALDLRPDVAIVDLGLPGIDGYEVARRIRAAPPGPPMFLIALTGYGQPDDRRRALAAGFDAHMVKPIDADRLAAVLATLPHRSPGG